MDNLEKSQKVRRLINASGKDLNLGTQYIHNFWANKSKEQSGLHSRIMAMDSVEFWAKNNEISVQTNLVELAKLLSNTKEIYDEALISVQQIERMLLILAHLNSSVAFRIINWLDENRNSVMIKLVTYSLEKVNTDGKMGADGKMTPEGVLIDRMNTLNTLSMLQEIFNPDVTQLIKKSLQSFEEKERA